MSEREQLDATSVPMSTIENIQNACVLRDDELDLVSGGEIRRSMPNGKTDVIKAMGNTKWPDNISSSLENIWSSLFG
jgi:hypothetical protein